MDAPTPSRPAGPARLDAVLAEYLERRDRGEAVDRAAFLAAHPDLADDLRLFFEGSDAFARLAPRPVKPTPGQGTRPPRPCRLARRCRYG